MFKPVDPKINFVEMEKRILKWWYESGLVKKYLDKNKNSSKRFSFYDGPITANNPMGVHHGWGRTLKDLYQRFHNALGEEQRFQNGFDCQGLWVEVEVEKELKLRNKREIENLIPGDKKASIAKFVQLCKDRVDKFSEIQTEQSKRLGYFMDWDNSYYTMSDENNYMIWHFLKTCHQKGWIYKGKESVPWCPRCETAISQHEMLTEDYKEVTHESIFLKLPIVGRNKEFLLVWTTTPWTIPANIAVAVDEKFDYVLVETEEKELLWVAKDLAAAIFKDQKYQIKKTIKGKELADLKYSGPFDDLEAVKKVANENPGKFHLVILTDKQILPITNIEGTGLVHTAVSAGAEDFQLGKKYGLPMIPVIADNADYLSGLGEFSGKNAKKHPEIILDYLKNLKEKSDFDWVFKIEKYLHRYPACWRCKAELVWKVADEWYIAMDKIDPVDAKKRTLRQEMIDVANQIEWLPEFGLSRELDWLKNMHDWLISKPNRYWGLALPIYECKECQEVTVVGSKEELHKLAVSGWPEFDGHSPHKPFIDEVKIKCPKCSETVSRLPDVGNVWLDAGIISFSTLIDPQTKKISYLADKKYWQKWFPADFITESFPGQFKNWFYSMIAMATVLERQPAFKKILGYATLVAEDGRPMHKSWGNSIEFNEGADKMGVDVMRWTYALQNPTLNLNFGFNIANETRRRFHLILWNVYGFFVMYANQNKFKVKSAKLKVKNEKTNILDWWIVSRLNQTIKIVTEALNSYNNSLAAEKIEKFVSELSTWYIRRSRDRIGTMAESETDKTLCLETLYGVLTSLCQLLAPFTPFLAEEMYKNLTEEESVHLADWPQIGKINEKIEKDMELVRKICEMGHAIRKEVGIKVRQPLAKFKIRSSKCKVSDELKILIKAELNVKDVEIIEGEGELKVEFDTVLTPELIAEGQARDLVRKIQDLRKANNLKPSQLVIVYAPLWPKEFESYIKKKALVHKLIFGKEFLIKEIS